MTTKEVIKKAYIKSMVKALLTKDRAYDYHEQKMLDLLWVTGHTISEVEKLQKQACKQAYG